MKAVIVKTDGVRIEAEGTPEEIATLAGAPATQIVYVDRPCLQQHYPLYQYQQHPYVWPSLPWSGGYTQVQPSLGWAWNTNAAAGGALPYTYTISSGLGPQS